MAGKNIGLLVAKLNRAIQKGVDLFNDYKKISKEFQNLKKNLMNNTELKKEVDNLKQKYDEEMKIIIRGRKGINNLKFTFSLVSSSFLRPK